MAKDFTITLTKRELWLLLQGKPIRAWIGNGEYVLVTLDQDIRLGAGYAKEFADSLDQR